MCTLRFPSLPSLSSKLRLCGSFQGQNVCREGRRHEGWKQGLLMQHACVTALDWSTRLSVGCCLFWFSAWQMGFSCAPHSVYQFPIDKSILVTRHKGTHVQDSFCAGSGNRSTYSRVRWQSPFFVLHHLIWYWKMWPQQLSVQWAVKWGGLALVSPLPPALCRGPSSTVVSFICAEFRKHHLSTITCPYSHTLRYIPKRSCLNNC